MSKLPIVSAKEFEKILLRIGFLKIRQKGSHAFYRHPDGRYTTLPHHKGERFEPTAHEANSERDSDNSRRI